jgi:hypothetical protein
VEKPVGARFVSYIKHHAIVVTTRDGLIKNVAEKARSLFPPKHILGPSPTTMNTFQTLVIVPDGSNDNWPESNEGDALRAKFKRWLRSQCFEDGSNPYDWVEVSFSEWGDYELSGNQRLESFKFVK